MSYVNAPVQIGATAIHDDPLSGEWSEAVPNALPPVQSLRIIGHRPKGDGQRCAGNSVETGR